MCTIFTIYTKYLHNNCSIEIDKSTLWFFFEKSNISTIFAQYLHIIQGQFTKRLTSPLALSDKYTGHSLHRSGESTIEIQAAGDWTSNSFMRYVFMSLEPSKAQLSLGQKDPCISGLMKAQLLLLFFKQLCCSVLNKCIYCIYCRAKH